MSAGADLAPMTDAYPLTITAALDGALAGAPNAGQTNRVALRLPVQQLQQMVGNRAVSAQLQRAPQARVQREPPPSPVAAPVPTQKTAVPRVDSVAETIYSALHIGGITAADKERVLSEILLVHNQATDLRTKYKESYKLELDQDLNGLGDSEALKARDYLNHGRLRTMSKVLIALAGTGTDNVTLFRVLADLKAEGEPNALWADVFKDEATKSAFSSFSGQSFDEALDSDLDWSDFVKAKALAYEGKLRPVDEIYVAMKGAGTDEAMLFKGLGSANADKIKDEYKNYAYGEKADQGKYNLIDDLDSELSGEDYDRALALMGLERNPNAGLFNNEEKTRPIGANQKLLALVKAAVNGAGTNTQLIWDSIAKASEQERAELKAKVEDPADPLGLSGWFGDLNAGDLARLRAMLGIKEPADAAGLGNLSPSVLDDPLVKRIRAAGGVDNDTVFDKIKMSNPLDLKEYKAAFQKVNSPFEQYVSKNTVASEKGDLRTVFLDDLRPRLDFCYGVTDDEDYLFHLLGNFASNDDRRKLGADAGFMAKTKEHLTSSEFDRALTLLRPTDMSESDYAKWLNEAVGRERGGFFDMFTSTGDAVQDENRELQAQAAWAGMDASLTPAERRLLGQQSKRTEGALQNYTEARDDFANTASMVVNIAAGVVFSLLTAGAGAPLVAAQVARVALAMAMTRVLTEKVIRGDKFDIIGSDGAVAFASGAVDGVTTLTGAVAARGIVSAGFETLGASARQAAQTGFGKVAVKGLTQVTEGAVGGGAGGFVETAARDETWRQGFLPGVESVVKGTALGAGVGAVAAGGMFAGGEVLGATLGKGGKPLPLSDPGNPLVGAIVGGDEKAARQLVEQMGRWEDGMRHIQAGTGLAEGLSDETRKSLLAALQRHRQTLVDFLGKQFDAHPAAGASTEAISDVDLSVKGEKAGTNLIAAEQFLDATIPGWQKKYRMALMVDANRVGTYAEAMQKLDPGVQKQIQARVTREVETLTFARRLRNAEAAEREAMLKEPPPGIDVDRAKQIADMGDGARQQLRNEALLEGDRLMQRMSQVTDAAENAKLAEQVTFQQMLANAMGDDAYISPGGIKKFVLGQALKGPSEAYQALLDQVDMMGHAVHSAGGVLEAMRSYELFKYINRFCQVVEGAGIQDPELAWFKNWSELVYKVDRPATGATPRPEGITPGQLAKSANDANVRYTDLGQSMNAPSDQFLLDEYRRFQKFADRHGADLRSKAMGEPGAPPASGTGGPPPSTAGGAPPSSAGGPPPGTTGGTPASTTGAPPASSPRGLTHVPDPTAADLGGAVRKAVDKDAAEKAILSGGPLEAARTTDRTLEELLAAVGADSEAGKQVKSQLDALLKKTFADITPLEFKHSSTIYKQVFEIARAAVARQKSFIDDIVARLGIQDAKVVSILKRDSLVDFVEGVFAKCERNKYTKVSQMDDLIRGRIDLPTGDAVEKVTEMLRTQTTHPFVPESSSTPRVKDGVIRYPRYHVIVKDGESGLTHEWQIGTIATSKLYEAPGVVIPDALKAAAEKMGKHFKPDIHDIEYDLFQAVVKKHPDVAGKYGLPDYVKKVAQASHKSAQGEGYSDLAADLASLHKEASDILAKMVAGEGPEWVAGFFH